MYNMTIIYLLVSMLISISIFMMNLIFSQKFNKSREKVTPFECGFNPISNPYTPMSLNFYFIALIFLIFDMEIILIIPLTNILHNLSMTMMTLIMLFIILLLVSLWFEWWMNMFKWII